MTGAIADKQCDAIQRMRIGKHKNKTTQHFSKKELPMRTSPLVIALALATAVATPSAFAQDSADSAAGKRFSVVGGISQYQPTKNAWTNGSEQRIQLDGGPAPTLGFTYHITDNWGVEAWGAADKISQRVKGNDGQPKLGNIDTQPYAVSAQYQFRDADAIVRPFVGLGYYQQEYSGERTQDALAGQTLGVKTAKGGMATVGVDANINSSWFARADLRYLHDGNSAVKLNGTKVADADFSPVMLGVGLGLRF